MIKQLENYYLAINNAELALSRGVDRAENAEQAANKKIHDMTAAARLDISSRGKRIKQLERWINSAKTSHTEAHLPVPTETINGIDSFGPFQNSLEKMVHLREELATQEKVEKGLESENHASKRASIVGLLGIVFAVLTLLLGNTMLAWFILPAYAVGVFVSGRRYWRSADPAAGAFTLSRIQRGEKVGFPMLPTALFMTCYCIFGFLGILTLLDEVIGPQIRIELEKLDYQVATGAIIFVTFATLAAGACQNFGLGDDDADLSRYRSRIFGAAYSGQSLMIAGVASLAIGLLASAFQITPVGGFVVGTCAYVVFTLGLILYATSQRTARKLSEDKREALKKAQAMTT